MRKKRLIKGDVARRWTRSAVECYEIGCMCSRCYLPLIMETPCQMKIVVMELVRKFGKPETKHKRDFINET